MMRARPAVIRADRTMLQRTVSSVITRAGPGSAANHGLLTSASTTGRTASWKLCKAAQYNNVRH